MHKNLFFGKTIHIRLIGAGGSGSQMLTGLARMNQALRSLQLGELQVVVYDPDTVSTANIGRQLFAPADVGQNKAQVLVNRLNAYFGTDWEAVPERYGPEESRVNYQDSKLFISCVDTRAARADIYAAIRKDAAYWLDLGNSSHTGQAILGNADFATSSWPRRKKYGLLPCVADCYPEMVDTRLAEDNVPSCSLAEALEKQDLMVNQVVVTHALELLWQLLREGEIAYQGFFFDAKAFRLQPLRADREAWEPLVRRAKRQKAASQQDRAA